MGITFGKIYHWTSILPLTLFLLENTIYSFKAILLLVQCSHLNVNLVTTVDNGFDCGSSTFPTDTSG